MYTVYKHTSPSGKIYIGITKQKVQDRWKKGKGYKGQVFELAIKKYGWGNIIHEIIYEGLTKNEAEKIEIDLIKKYKSNNKKYGYNVANGGNTLGTMSEETKEKIRKSNINKKRSLETRKRISKSKRGKKRKPLSEETKEKIRQTKTGYKNPMYGVRGDKCPMHYKTGAKNHYAKRVLCVTTGEIFECMEDAASKYKLSANLISKCCRGKQKTTGGMIFKYA